ncbi:MAG TPA: 4'-phosphopantetheinyl transferase superfamily protein [Solirubrobacterales bacterium]|nr:4'-phosphopantetheinyl transferase superfamily protein [Solirubrobacterales bacterium]
MIELGDEVHVWQAELSGREAAHGALREILGRYLDRPAAEIELETGGRGKPRLPGEERLRFNLSHSGEIVAVAVTLDREVGIDVERIDPGRDVLKLAPRALPPEDADAVAASPPEERVALFHRAWARREAAAKCLGVGLAGHAAELSARDGKLSVAPLDFGPGYAAALAVAGEMPPLRRFDFEPQ